MTSNQSGECPVVWLKEYRTFGWLITVDAYTSIVEYTLNGEIVAEAIENDEYEFWDEHHTDYEQE